MIYPARQILVNLNNGGDSMSTITMKSETVLTTAFTESNTMKFLKGLNKNQKGLTLIELLAVIVIMAIIAAIAVPSITGIITNTKYNTQKANAQVLIDSARMMIASEDFKADSGTNDGPTQTIRLETLKEHGYLDKVPVDPVKNANYSETASQVIVTRDVNGALTYAVTLAPGSGSAYFTGIPESNLKALTTKQIKDTQTTTSAPPSN